MSTASAEKTDTSMLRVSGLTKSYSRGTSYGIFLVTKPFDERCNADSTSSLSERISCLLTHEFILVRQQRNQTSRGLISGKPKH